MPRVRKKRVMVEKLYPSKIVLWSVSHLMTWEMCCHSCAMVDRMSMPTQLHLLGSRSYSVVHRQPCILSFSIKYRKEGNSDTKEFIDAWHPLFFFFFYLIWNFLSVIALFWGSRCSKLPWLTHFVCNTLPLPVWQNYKKHVSKTVFCSVCSNNCKG